MLLHINLVHINFVVDWPESNFGGGSWTDFLLFDVIALGCW